MLPIKPFILKQPKSLDELFSELAKANEKTKIMAGGTDLIPNLKHGLYDLDQIISLKNVDELKGFHVSPEQMTMGALVTLSMISSNNKVIELYPALAKASCEIASPQIRNMGTVGGNICLDTRCLYFNQTEFWRKSLGYCLKKDGCACHVVKTGKRCVAAATNDLATALLAYDAKVTLASRLGQKTIPLNDLYLANGEKNNVLAQDEVVTKVMIAPYRNTRVGFFKLRHRASIDFPLLSIAVGFTTDKDNKLMNGRVVINAVVSKPKVMSLEQFTGIRFSIKLAEEIARMSERKSHPQTNIWDSTEWRKEMIFHAVKSAFINAMQGLWTNQLTKGW